MQTANKREPVRTCVGCRKRFPQPALVRFVATRGAEGTAWDADGWRKRRPGRGAYLCSSACAARVAKNRRYPGLAPIAMAFMAEGEGV